MHHDLGALGTAVNRRALERQLEILKGMGRTRSARATTRPRRSCSSSPTAWASWCWTRPSTRGAGRRRERLRQLFRRLGAARHPTMIRGTATTERRDVEHRQRDRRVTSPTPRDLKNWSWRLRHPLRGRPTRWAARRLQRSTIRNVAGLLDIPGFNYDPSGDYAPTAPTTPGWKLVATEISAACAAAASTTRRREPSPKHLDSLADHVVSPTWWRRVGRLRAALMELRSFRALSPASFLWAGFDYLGEPTPYSSWPRKSSYFGTVDPAGFPKDLYYLYQSHWTEAPMVHVLPHWNWTSGTNDHRLRLHELRQRRAVPEQHVAGDRRR